MASYIEAGSAIVTCPSCGKRVEGKALKTVRTGGEPGGWGWASNRWRVVAATLLGFSFLPIIGFLFAFEKKPPKPYDPLPEGVSEAEWKCPRCRVVSPINVS